MYIRLTHLSLLIPFQVFSAVFFAIAEENYTNVMLMMGRSLLDMNRIEHIDVIFQQIEKQTSNSLLELAEEMFAENQLNYLIFNPRNNADHK